MSGRRLLRSLSRRRSIFQSAFACNRSPTIVLADKTPLDLGDFYQKGNDFYIRIGGFRRHLFHHKSLSVVACSDHISPYDEASTTDTCSHHQQGSHDTSVDITTGRKEGTNGPGRSRRAKQTEASGKLKGNKDKTAFQSSFLTHHDEFQERCKVVSDGLTKAASASENASCQLGSLQGMTSSVLADSNDYINKVARPRSVCSHLSKGDNMPDSTQQASSMHNTDRNDQGRHYGKATKDGRQHHGEPKSKAGSEVEDPSTKLDLSDSEQVFQALLVSKPSGMPKHERDALAQVFRHFLEAGWALEQALFCCYVSSVIFPVAVSRFRKFFFSRCTPDIKTHLLELGPSADGDQFLFPLFSEFSSKEFPGEIARYKALVEKADLTKPHTWFPFARAMKRKIIYHSGPTNSGKTYNAIQRFKDASSGIYCGPLRLLAMEVFDSVNADGVYCSLSTGQEKKEVPFANHVACTVEMVSTQKTWEVAVIDEIQMLTDEFRGWAWTRAFLGVQANEVHVCGDPSALSLVRDMCAITGDEMEEFYYERFEPLSIDQQSLEGKYRNIQPGDCIVSFSRKEIFSIKRAVELGTTNRCCVIYGALPPETRTHQAKLFNDPNSGYDVLVATDAVGMGLNLNIRRVVFHTLDKYNGDMLKKVSASQVKQIAGRAGRRGTLYPLGTATTFYSRDIPYLVQCMQEPFVEAHSAGLFPMYEQMELFATQLPEATFSKLLDRFAETCQVDGSFFLCRNDNLKKVASIIDKVQGLTMEDKMSFILSPVNSRDPKVIGALLSFALAYSKKLPVHLAMVAPMGSARSVLQLMDLEARHQVLSLYLWLSQHFPEEYFPQKEQAEQMAAEIALLLGESLAQTDIRIVQSEHRGPVRKKVLNSQRRHSQSQVKRASRVQ